MALPKVPTPAPYRRAQLQARSVAGSLTAEAAKRVRAAVHEYSQRLTAQLSALPANTPAQIRAAIQAAANIGKKAALDMDAAIIAAIAQNRRVAFDEILIVYQAAGRAAATTAGVPKALLGAIQTPGVTMAGAYEALGGAASTWKASLSASAKAASHEVDTIIRTGLANEVGPQELARRLRPYMQGAEEFEKAFPKIDDRMKAIHTARAKLPPELRNASFRMQSNALRAAYSEVHNARAEAELQAFALDPLVAAVAWELSPFRGTQTRPDACNVYAQNDFYGLGPGLYPLDAVPLPPHPRDRCERIPRTRPPDEWSKPKPVALKRKLKPSQIKVASGNGLGALTAVQAAALRSHVGGLFRQLERHASKGAVRKLIDQGYNAGVELAEVAAARQALLTALQTAEAIGGETVVGSVTIPGKLTGQALDDAQSLVKKAAGKSAVALQALKDLGADTTQLEAKLAAQKAAAKAKAAAKKAKAAPAPIAPKPPVITDPPAPAPIPVPAPAPTIVPAAANPLKEVSISELQIILKENGVYLLTKKQMADHFEDIADALQHAFQGNPAGVSYLKKLGANTTVLEKKMASGGLKPPAPKPPTVLDGPKDVAPPPAPAPPVKPTAPKPPKPATPTIERNPGAVILHDKVGAQAGSNPGGIYKGTDGALRYVKEYDSASQAHGEAIANEIYRRLSLTAPSSTVFTHGGKVYHAAKLLDGVTEASQVGKLGLTQARARAALNGFASDVLTANWDAPGLLLDNMVEVAPGVIARIDNGAAFLYRAQGTLKPANLLNNVSEWDGFAPGALNKNSQYAQLFKAAGYQGPADMAEELIQQIDAIVSLEKQVGGWAAFIEKVAPAMDAADRQKVVAMLHARSSFLVTKRVELEKAVASAKQTKAIVSSGAPMPGNTPSASEVYKQIKGLKMPGTLKLAKAHGIDLDLAKVHQASLSLGFLKQQVAKAVGGSQHALDILEFHFKADASKLAAKLGLKSTPQAVQVPSVLKPPTTAAPIVPSSVVIGPHQVAGVQAASKVPEPLYWQGGSTSLKGLSDSGVQLAKLPTGKFGFELEYSPTPLKPSSKGYAKLHVVAKNPGVFTAANDSELHAAIEKLVPGWSALSDTQKREALIAKGWDAIVAKDAQGKAWKLVALKPETVKVVKEVVVPPPPKVAAQSGTVGAHSQGGLANRSPSTEPLVARANDTADHRALREAREAFRTAFTEYERQHLSTHTAAALAQKDPVMKKAYEWRRKELRRALARELGVTHAEATKIQSAWDKAVHHWLGSSSSEGAAVMKLAAEDVHNIASTTYHGRYFDHVAHERRQFFESIAENGARSYGVTRAQLATALRLDERLNRAFLMEALGVKDGETFKVWRGVSADYFHNHRIPLPNVGEEAVVTMSSVSSFSMNQPFSGVVLELEATLDDVAVQYTLLNVGRYYREREIWVIGRPRKMRRVS